MRVKCVEESIASDLHRELVRHFSSVVPAAQLSLSGAGVNWRCTAEHGERRCEINCFDAHFCGRDAEYLSSFKESGQTIVWGRTNSNTDAIAGVSRWLQGSSPEDLQAEFEFVDNQKRNLLKIAQAVTECFPRIREETTQGLKRLTCDLCEFWFVERDRACKLSFFGKNEFADAAFHWDKSELFRFRAEDMAKLGAVLMRWLCERSKPSKMRNDFPWLEIGELADFYENGKPIEGEFVMSWKSIERFYTKLEFPPKEQILNMIAEMRRCGYDKTLRAGQSMFSLVLSRSRRHGLRQHQPCLTFSFKEDSMAINARFENEENFLVPQIELSPQVDALLQRLVSTAID